MPLKIRHTYRAHQDFHDIWDFIALDNEQAADALLRALNAKIVLLAEQPEIGRQRPDLGVVRSIPHERYVIFYRTDERSLHVVRVLSSYRNVTPEMLRD